LSCSGSGPSKAAARRPIIKALVLDALFSPRARLRHSPEPPSLLRGRAAPNPREFAVSQGVREALLSYEADRADHSSFGGGRTNRWKEQVSVLTSAPCPLHPGGPLAQILGRRELLSHGRQAQGPTGTGARRGSSCVSFSYLSASSPCATISMTLGVAHLVHTGSNNWLIDVG
jgi:hypothetical protein